MFPRVVHICFLMATIVVVPATANAQVRPPEGWGVALGAGGTAYTALHRTGESKRLSPHTSGMFMAALNFWPTRNWGIRAQGTLMPTRFEEIEPAFQMQADSITYAPLTIESYQVQANFRMPTIRNRIMPYGIAGGGVMRFKATRRLDQPLPKEAVADFGGGTRQSPSASFGLGARVQSRDNGWALNFELVDQIARSPMDDVPGNQVRYMNAASFIIGFSWTLYSR